MQVFHKTDIEKCISLKDDLAELMLLQRKAFIDFSAGHINTPMPLQMSFKIHQVIVM